MESTKNRKKGLLSIVSLMVCLAMLTVGTFAWFTDTATVKGNKVMAGTLAVDVVATVQEVLDAFSQDYYKENYNSLSVETPTSPDTDPDGGSLSPKAFVGKKFDALGLKVAKSTTPGNVGKAVKTDGDGTDVLKPEGDVLGDYCVVTEKTVPIVNISDVEPGATYPVQIHVKNSGDLAISYAAGFSVDNGNSKTGLQALEAQKTALGTEKYNYLVKKLAPKQLKKNADGTDKTYSSSMAGTADDLGGKLEDVLEVYAMTKAQYEASQDPTSKEAAMDLVKENPDASKINYIGKISEIMHCNDTAYKMDLDAKVDAANQTKTDTNTEKAAKEAAYEALIAPVAPGEPAPTEDEIKAAKTARDKAREANKVAGDSYDKLYEEQQELKKVAERLAKAASGYCVPEGKESPTPITVYERDGNPRQVVDPTNPAGAKIDQQVDAVNIGTTYFAIHMPETVDDLYQNAMLTLNAGITANQVELDTDGIHVMVYDDQTARTTTAD